MSDPSPSRRRRLGHELTAVAIVALVVTGAVVALHIWLNAWQRPQTVVFNSVPFGLLVSAAIAASASALLIVIDPIARRLHPALRWTVWIATFVAAAVAGTWMAAALLVVIGAAPRERVLVVFSQNIAGTIPTSIVVGTFIMTVGVWRARVQAAQAALQAARFDRERAERLAAEARLASLSARVQPHFLFNTLNAIAALVGDDPGRAEQMVEQLSGVLRTSLDTATTVPVEREMKLVDDYLRIQQTRLGDRLRFEILWDADTLRGATIPPFAVQTLVENAVKHVGGKRLEGVSIQVRASLTNGMVVVDVRDDGDGFDHGAIEAGHGLDDLDARLRAVYGERARLEIDSPPGGCAVRLRLPLMTGVA